ncbi:MAG: sulfite exporter TauE/SafE family protein, partial [Desulfobacteraceae bacterium]|nr:sulfite exporter TauE/SafE family protein [Desulfobacteraceae bacterium]
MHFPVAGIDVHPMVPLTVSFVVSFFTSMGGVSGAFLLLPFQVSVLNYTAPSVSATNQVFNIFAIPSGVYRYIREGRMLWPLTRAVVAGTLPGVFIGAWVRVEYLPEPTRFKFFAAFVLLYIGWRLAGDVMRNPVRSASDRFGSGQVAAPRITVTVSSVRRVAFHFGEDAFSFSPPVVYAICFLVGIAG